MIKKIKDIFSNKKNEENNINDLFSEIDKINLSLLEKLENNQKMILSYNNENRK